MSSTPRPMDNRESVLVNSRPHPPRYTSVDKSERIRLEAFVFELGKTPVAYRHVQRPMKSRCESPSRAWSSIVELCRAWPAWPITKTCRPIVLGTLRFTGHENISFLASIRKDSRQTFTSEAMLSNGLSLIPSDPIFETTRLFLADTNTQKVNLGAGTYKDNDGQPFIFPAVKQAKHRLANGNHEYLTILGLPKFRQEAKKLLFGAESKEVAGDMIAVAQTLSGTGSLHLAGSFLRRVTDSTSMVYVTDPSWSNHRAVFETVGFPVQGYQYLNHDGRFDFETLCKTLNDATSGSIFILHTSAHNPSGRDPTREQWREICQIMQERRLFPLFDAAYLGLTTGDFDNDAWPIRHFVEQGLELAVCLSFAKMMGLYGERVGALLLLSKSKDETTIIESHLEQLIRAEVSSPPAFGAKIAAEVLGDPELTISWKSDLSMMSLRLQGMRQTLVSELKRLGCKKDFEFIVEQTGMFTLLGLNLEQVTTLRKQYSIYMADGPSQLSRVSIAGLNDGNVTYVAEAITAVCKQ